LQHLPIPARLLHNLEMKFYPSGHMIYASEPSLRALHDNIAALVKRTSTAGPTRATSGSGRSGAGR
jgi:carboxypeptidase C (cathepsin A)